MQKHSKIRNVPFPRPCGATGNDAQKLHAPAFAHFRDAAFMHEVLCVASKSHLSPAPSLLLSKSQSLALDCDFVVLIWQLIQSVHMTYD